jgi:hypothetical protein
MRTVAAFATMMGLRETRLSRFRSTVDGGGADENCQELCDSSALIDGGDLVR